MTRGAVSAVVAALLLTVAPRSAAAQSATVLLSEGISAYTDLEFVAASRLLQRALAPETTPPLSPEERDRALMYLGAAAIFLGDRGGAVTTFRSLVVASPRFWPNRMKFPPEVTRVFDETRQTTKAVAVELPKEITLTPGADPLPLRLYASSSHQVRVAIRLARGDTLVTLFAGAITDSMSLSWNGLDSLGQTPVGGLYVLEAASMVVPDTPLRTLRIPLQITRLRPDTLIAPETPPDSLFLPERTGGRPSVALLVPGLVVGAALAIPAASGHGGSKGLRIGIGGALSVASVIAAVKHKSDRPIPQNIARNDSTRSEWDRRALEVAQRNKRLARVVRLVIRAGPPERVEAR